MRERRFLSLTVARMSITYSIEHIKEGELNIVVLAKSNTHEL